MLRLSPDIKESPAKRPPTGKELADFVNAGEETRQEIGEVMAVNQRAVEIQREKAWPIEACTRLAELELQTTVDELTGIANRRKYMERMKLDLAQADRFGEPFSVVMIDIDNFKSFNDRYGHEMGDIVLKEVAGILKQETRAELDLVARYGGEEFMVVLSSTDEKGAKITAEKLVKAIEKRTKNRNFPPVTISAGTASFNKEALNTENQIRAAADKALYQSKANGRNQATVYEEGMAMPEKKQAKATGQPIGTNSMTGEQMAQELMVRNSEESSTIQLPNDLKARIQALEALLHIAKSEVEATQKKTGTEG